MVSAALPAAACAPAVIGLIPIGWLLRLATLLQKQQLQKQQRKATVQGNKIQFGERSHEVWLRLCYSRARPDRPAAVHRHAPATTAAMRRTTWCLVVVRTTVCANVTSRHRANNTHTEIRTSSTHYVIL
jgi:hypothetical protein